MAKGEFALGRESFENALSLEMDPAKWGSAALLQDLYAMLTDVAVLERNLQVLLKYAPLAEEIATRYDHRLYLGIAWRARGVAHRLLGEHAQAEARLNQALDTFREVGANWQLGRTWFELGELALARSQREQAHACYSQARLAFANLGAVLDETQASAALATIL
ncbi:MAG TPA: tetratricopeptide repeat protein [Anaerolineales bacterium]|nr:tetratricopeptide repeat protein [Anaerolineales bacterium]